MLSLPFNTRWSCRTRDCATPSRVHWRPNCVTLDFNSSVSMIESTSVQKVGQENAAASNGKSSRDFVASTNPQQSSALLHQHQCQSILMELQLTAQHRK